MALSKKVTIRSLQFFINDTGVLENVVVFTGVREIKDGEEMIKVDNLARKQEIPAKLMGDLQLFVNNLLGAMNVSSVREGQLWPSQQQKDKPPTEKGIRKESKHIRNQNQERKQRKSIERLAREKRDQLELGTLRDIENTGRLRSIEIPMLIAT